MGRAARWFTHVLIPVLAACGTAPTALDAGNDASTDGGAAIARSCIDFLAAEEGAACEGTWPCVEDPSGFCARTMATCEAGQLRHSHDAWTLREDASCPEGDVGLEALGPGQSLSFDRGAGSATDGFTTSRTLLFTEGVRFDACAAPRLVVRFGPDFAGYVGVLPAAATLRLEDGDRELEGTVSIDSYDEHGSRVLTGSVDLEGAGWTIAGNITLTMCAELAMTSL